MPTERELLIRLDATSAQLRRELARGEKSFNTFARNSESRARKFESRMDKSISGAGKSLKNFASVAVVGAGVALVARELGDLAERVKDLDEIAKTAQFADVTAEGLQEIRFAAGLAGVEAGQVDKALIKLTRSVGELRAGTGTLTTLLNKAGGALGDQLKAAKNTDEAFEIILTAIDKMPSAFDRAALANAAFGRSGQILINVLKDGKDAFDATRESADGLGQVVDDAVVKKAEQAADKMQILGTKWRNFWSEVAISLAESFGIVDQLPEERIEELKDFVDQLENATAKSFNSGLLTNANGAPIQNPDTNLVIRSGDKEEQLRTAKLQLFYQEEIIRKEKERAALIKERNVADAKAIEQINAEAKRTEELAKQNDKIKLIVDQTNDYISSLERAARQKGELAQATALSTEQELAVSTEIAVQNNLLRASNQLKREGLSLSEEQASRIREATEAAIEAENKRRDAIQSRRDAEREDEELEREHEARLEDILNDRADKEEENQRKQQEQIDKTKEAYGSMFDRIVSGSLDSKEAVVELIKELIIAQIRAKFLESIGGGTGGGGGGGQQGNGIGGFFASLFHTGGRVGSPAAGRFVDPSIFSGAKRLHEGGIAGDEVPAILKKNEIVINPDTLKQTNGSSGGGPMRVVVENKGGAKQVENIEQGFDAEGSIMKVILNDQKKNGPITQGFAPMFGGRSDYNV